MSTALRRRSGNRTVVVTMSVSLVTAQAVYESAIWNLTVESQDIAGITITGAQPGVTDYGTLVDDDERISLVAPSTSMIDPLNTTWFFDRWRLVNGVAHTRGARGPSPLTRAVTTPLWRNTEA